MGRWCDGRCQEVGGEKLEECCEELGQLAEDSEEGLGSKGAAVSMMMMNFIQIRRVATKAERACGRTSPIVRLFVLVLFSWNINITDGILETPNKRKINFPLICYCNLMRNSRLFLPLNQFVLAL